MLLIINTIQLHAYEAFTRSEGPGHRICIWVQGCSLKCPNCFNEETWSLSGGETVEIDALFERMMEDVKRHPTIEGVTFLGGEPFLQAAPLAKLAQRLKNEHLSIVTFSGFTYEAMLKANLPHWNDLLKQTDLLLDGPYIDELVDLNRPWIGSLNQNYRFLTKRYAELEKDIQSIPNKIEIRLKKDGTVHVNGIAQRVTLEELKKLLNKQ